MNDDKKGLGVAAEDSGRSTAFNSSPETGSGISGLRPNALTPQASADEWDDDCDGDHEEVVAYYVCLGCGGTQLNYHNGECDKCCAYALDEVYE